MQDTQGLGVCVFGAAPDTGNLGVSALLQSTLEGLARRVPDVGVTVFDNGLGARTSSTPVDDGHLQYRKLGARLSRRWHRPESLASMRISARLGGFANPGTRVIRDADAALDVSGGDSFTDLYGARRFRATIELKRVALTLRTPLVFLPQTYGPFAGPGPRQAAVSVLRSATAAWARDRDSFDALRELLGEAFDPGRHRSGVDLAFGLTPRPPGPDLRGPLEEWIGASAPVVGLNVSGLVLDQEGARERFALTCDYAMVVRTLLRRLLDDGARVLFVPHVRPDGPALDPSDDPACERLIGELPASVRQRVAMLPPGLGPAEVKWFVGQLDWLCGTRMHATIAALSSGVPAAAIAYSLKTRGVFETCRQEERVADARDLDTDEVLDVVWDAWSARAATRAELAITAEEVRRRAESQMDDIVVTCRARRELRRAAG